MNPTELISSVKSSGAALRQLLNLRGDMDEPGTVVLIRENANFRSANAWTLVFAIFVASIGLNTNSAAVIIGAMLISPLMGPIVAAGLALGLNDFELLKKSLTNLLVAICISVVTSTIYFLISPLSEIQSELLARTNPTFFDVMIAFFGGAAGIIAVSRNEKGNAIPGVAIATALMPPLCTAGFGLSRGEPKYFFGALYLFVINSVFICLSTYLFVRIMKFKRVEEIEGVSKRRIQQWIAATAIAVVLPSLFLAWILQRETLFTSKANAFITHEMRFERTFVVDREIYSGWKKNKILVRLLGESLSAERVSMLKEKMKEYGLKPESLEIKQASLEDSLEKRLSEKFGVQSNQIQEYEVKLSQRDAELEKYAQTRNLSQKITSEAKVLFSNIDQVLVFPSQDFGKTSNQVTIQWKTQPKVQDRKKLALFLEQRIPIAAESILHTRVLSK